MLGKFEEFTLMALTKAGPDAMAADVYETIIDVLGKSTAFGATYTTIERLVEKGFVKVEVQKASEQTRGRHRKLYTITGEGRLALAASLDATSRMQAGLDLGLVGQGI
jgi:PadR family transcriptional regulator, regulatory protein PadR